MNAEAEVSDEDFDPVTALSGPLMKSVLNDVAKARQKQDGELGFFRDYSDGTCGRAIYGPTISREKEAVRESRRKLVDAGRAGKLTWRHLLEVELLEVFTESEPPKLRGALVLLAAQSVAWIEAIDRRKDEKRIERKQRPGFWVRAWKWMRQ